jgi:ADP-ribose pyrophosphatase YjhB (NUDIX family)
MKYCSECGMPVQPIWVSHEQRTRHICRACGTTHYLNPKILVAGILFCGGRILLCRRAHPPARGKWIVPSGYLECGETLQECAARETFEEAGVIVDPVGFEMYSVMNMVRLDQVAVTLRMELQEEPVLVAGSECEQVAFVSEKEIQPDDLAWSDAMGHAPRRLFEEMRANQFSIYLSTLGSDESRVVCSRKYEIAPGGRVNLDRSRR